LAILAYLLSIHLRAREAVMLGTSRQVVVHLLTNELVFLFRL